MTSPDQPIFPILSQRLPTICQDDIADFDPMPPEFHYRLRSLLTREVPCGTKCTLNMCSCSGGSRGEIILLPGEREWSENVTQLKFRGDDPNRFPLAGDCHYLKGHWCQGGVFKPWDCISFPLQPKVIDGDLVPFFSKNCSIHPGDFDPVWIAERWKGWQIIHATIPRWVELYSEIPPYEETFNS